MKMFRQIGVVMALAICAFSAFAAPPMAQQLGERTPKMQSLSQAVGDMTAQQGGLMTAQTRQHQDLVQQLVKQQRAVADPPVMHKMVLPAGMVSVRQLWQEAAVSPQIPNLWDVATVDQKLICLDQSGIPPAEDLDQSGVPPSQGVDTVMSNSCRMPSSLAHALPTIGDDLRTPSMVLQT